MEPSPPIANMKPCAYCGELIKTVAVLCRYCGRNIKSATAISRFNEFALVICLILLLIAGASYYSPYWTLQQIRSAVQQKDEDALESLVDFSSLREGFKSDFMANAADNIENDPDLKNNPFKPLGLVFSTAVINSLADTFVSAPTLIKVINGESPSAIAKGIVQPTNQSSDLPAGYFKYSYHDPSYNRVSFDKKYKSFDRFIVLARNQESRFELCLYRTGLFSWKLNRIRFLPNEDISQVQPTQMVYVQELNNKLPLAKNAGIKEWDQIVAINGQSIHTLEEAMALLSIHKNDRIKLNLLRNDRPITIEIKTSTDGRIGVYLIPGVECRLVNTTNDNVIELGGERYCVCYFPKRDLYTTYADPMQIALLNIKSKIRIVAVPTFVSNTTDNSEPDLRYVRQDELSDRQARVCLDKIKVVDGEILCRHDHQPLPYFVIDPQMIETCVNVSNQQIGYSVPSVTLNDLDRLSRGVSYANVATILGSSGIKEFETSYGAEKSVIYKWQNPNGSYVACIFENGILRNWYDFLLTNETTSQATDTAQKMPDTSPLNTDWD